MLMGESIKKKGITFLCGKQNEFLSSFLSVLMKEQVESSAKHSPAGGSSWLLIPKEKLIIEF